MLIATKVCKRDILFLLEMNIQPHQSQSIGGHSGLSNYLAHIIYEMTIVFYVGSEDDSPKF